MYMVDMYVLIRFKMILIPKIRVRIVINLICLNIIYEIMKILFILSCTN